MTAPIVAPRYPAVRTTPTELAELSDRADRARKHAVAAATVDLAGIPPPAARYRPTLDGPWLRRICERAIADRVAAVLTPPRRAQMTAAIVADLDARFDQVDMRVLRRYAAGDLHDHVMVDFGVAKGDWLKSFLLAIQPRWLPRRPTYLVPAAGVEHTVTPREPDHLTLPAAAQGWFDDMLALHYERPGIMAVTGWPSTVKADTGRWPVWRDIFTQFPIIGDFVAGQQDPARMAPDRGDTSEPYDVAPSHSGEAS